MMSDRMTPMHFSQLMDWAMDEKRKTGGIFGLRKFFSYPQQSPQLSLLGGSLEAPFGPAAGPHTQLAQNILAAYAAGARFFELKTVQIIDGEDLPVNKPCITAADECYNCEWSTELRVPQAFDEYVKAWFGIKLLCKEWDLGDPNAFLFNMSVGYDLKGIQSPKIDAYIEGMKNAKNTPVWKACQEWALSNLAKFNRIDATYVHAISPTISTSITLSTLHGCPPDEIERIATYLIEEKNLHTYVKCNPTLLGYEVARARLNALGYDYIAFNDHHFKEDLQFSDAVPMFQRLLLRCKAQGLNFGVKLTNTFPVDVTLKELPSEEMYMSGRALFPLTIAVAEKISEAFNGAIRISYSGGADARNIRTLLDAGIWPITMATTLLKPGGYRRMTQIASLLTKDAKKPASLVDVEKIRTLASCSLKDHYYQKPLKPLPKRKLPKKVPLSNCFISPCRGGCPIEQDIPAYLQKVTQKDYLCALSIITDRNPLPFITGTICSHHCMDMCKRNYYDGSVRIRSAKLEAAQGGFTALLSQIKTPLAKSKRRVAIVGGGAAGLAAAFFLAREGVSVTIFEARASLGGIVRHVIPAFRISEEAIENDVALVRAMGVDIRLNHRVEELDALRQMGYTDIILACGSWKPGRLSLTEGETTNVLDFLIDCRANPNKQAPGAHIAIIGGGNTAMDAARMATRLPGVEKVRIVYRRDKRNMPADEDELQLALADNVEFCELLAPLSLKNGMLLCNEMQLGSADASGRRSPHPTGHQRSIPADVVIAAVGEGIDEVYYTQNRIALDERNRPILSETLFSQSAETYVIGDAHTGPATVVEAIADAIIVSQSITGKKMNTDTVAAYTYEQAEEKKGDLDLTGTCGADKCLSCHAVCENCVDVCPNRANLSLTVPGMPMRQIIHVDGMCNECGNCEIFCPWDSAPYKEKWTLYWTTEEFESGTNEGFLFLTPDRSRCLIRYAGSTFEIDLHQPDPRLPENLRATIRSVPFHALSVKGE